MSSDLFSDLLAAVDQQLVSAQTPYVARTFERLVQAGLDPSEAKIQIAHCLGGEMDRLVRDKRGFDQAAYRAALEALPVSESEGDPPEIF